MAVHFTGPILEKSKSGARSWYDNLPVGRDPDYATVWDDFTGIALDTTNDWTEVKDTGASTAIEADTLVGRVLLSSAATTDNDGASLQGNEIFAVAAGKDIWFEIKLQVSDADQMDVWAGLITNFATNPEAALTTGDRIGFQIDDGNASILCKTEKDGTETSTDSGQDASDATDVRLGFHVIGTTEVEFFVDRSLVATHTTNIPDDENLAIGFMELSGDATGTKSMAVDYVYCSATR